MLKKIISGGQTGADQAALDVAIKMNIPHGGFLPKGRRTENGPLPAKYLLQEMNHPGYPQRTQANIFAADGTLIISHGRLKGGSALTYKLSQDHKCPCLHIDLHRTSAFRAARLISSWINHHGIQILNVAGTRASEDPEIFLKVSDIMEAVIYLDQIETSPSNFSGLCVSPEDNLEKPPRNIEQAVANLMTRLTLKEKIMIASLKTTELSDLQTRLEDYIGICFGLLTDNKALLESARLVSNRHNMHGDDALTVIIKQLWKKLQTTHKLRVIK